MVLGFEVGLELHVRDLEATLESTLGEAWGLRPGRVVAVSVPTDDGEAAVILAELRSELGEGARATP